MKTIRSAALFALAIGVLLLPATAEQGTSAARIVLQPNSGTDLQIKIETLRKRVLSEENGESREQRLTELEKVVLEYFETKQKRQMDEVERLKRELAATETVIQNRNARKNDIVKKLVDDVMKGGTLPTTEYGVTYPPYIGESAPLYRVPNIQNVPVGAYYNPVGPGWTETATYPPMPAVIAGPARANYPTAGTTLAMPVPQPSPSNEGSEGGTMRSYTLMPFDKSAVESVMRYRTAVKLLADAEGRVASGLISSTEVLKLSEEKETAKAIWEAQRLQLEVTIRNIQGSLALESKNLDALQKLFDKKATTEMSVLEAKQSVARLETTLEYLHSLHSQCIKLLKEIE